MHFPLEEMPTFNKQKTRGFGAMESVQILLCQWAFFSCVYLMI